jgi:hypothetical protein
LVVIDNAGEAAWEMLLVPSNMKEIDKINKNDFRRFIIVVFLFVDIGMKIGNLKILRTKKRRIFRVSS